jgi:hypothetical protein
VSPTSMSRGDGLRRTFVIAVACGGPARAGARGQAGGRRHEPAPRHAEASADGGGYRAMRWSNSKAGAHWSSGSGAGSCSASEAALSAGPRAGRDLCLLL